MVHPSRKGSVDQVCLGMQNMTQREKRHVPVLMYLRCIQKWLQQSMSIDRQGVMDQTCLYSWIAIWMILNVGIVLTYVHICSYMFCETWSLNVLEHPRWILASGHWGNAWSLEKAAWWQHWQGQALDWQVNKVCLAISQDAVGSVCHEHCSCVTKVITLLPLDASGSEEKDTFVTTCLVCLIQTTSFCSSSWTEASGTNPQFWENFSSRSPHKISCGTSFPSGCTIHRPRQETWLSPWGIGACQVCQNPFAAMS